MPEAQAGPSGVAVVSAALPQAASQPHRWPCAPGVWAWSARGARLRPLAPLALPVGAPLPRSGDSVDRWCASLPAALAAQVQALWSALAAGQTEAALAWPTADDTTALVGDALSALDDPRPGLLLQARARHRRDGALADVLLTWQPLALAPPPSVEHERKRRAYTAMVGHELRNPLNAITGFCALAHADRDESGLRAAIGQIDDAALLMRRVIDDLIDLERLDAGKLDIQHDQPLSLSALLSRVGALAAGLAGAPDTRLYTAADAALPDALRGDPHRLEQVLLNLVANAVRHTDAGMVLLAARQQARQGGQLTVRFLVADTGVGMALDDVDRVMQPYEQAGNDAARRRGGSGLGLAVVQRLLALHDSRLRVASVAGGGTIAWFDLVLPVDARDEAPELPCTALLCSDDPRAAQTLQLQWRARGQRLRSVSLADLHRLAGVALGGLDHVLIDEQWPDAAAATQAARAAGLRPWRLSTRPVALADRLAAEAAGEPLLHLPLAARSVLARGGPQPLAPRLPPARPVATALPVLVVEDNRLNQQVLEGLLRQQGLAVVIAATVAQALKLVARQGFALALVDGELPDGDGFALVRQWRADPATAALPVAFISARIDAARRDDARQLGALGCLLKPTEPARLLDLLEAAGARRPVTAPAPAWAVPDITPQFLAHRPQLVAPIEAALADGDAPRLRRAVHALRGTLVLLPGTLARQAAALARTVEDGLLDGQPPHGLPVHELLRHTAAVRAGD